VPVRLLAVLVLALLALSCSSRDPAERVERPEVRRLPGAPAQQPPDLSGDEVRLEVGDDFQSVVDDAPPGSTFVIASGVHRLQQVVPRDGDRFVGEPGAVLRGSRVLEDFTRQDGLFVASGQTQQGEVGEVGYMEEGREADAFPEELFLDGQRLRHVPSLDEVEPGAWHFDYDADRIYLADDPAGHLVETSLTPWAFGGEGVRDVTIENLFVEHYANRAQVGAIHGQDTRGWTVRAVDASYNHGTGIRIGPGWTVTGSRATYNGQMGIAGTADLVEDAPIAVRDSEIAYNKQLGYDWTWEGGATKFTKTTGMVFENNWVHDNIGPGPWFDIDNRDTVIRSNLIEGNSALGVHYEISYGAQIYWNTIRNNGYGDEEHTLGVASAVFISNSSQVEVFENVMHGNRNEVFALQDDRGSGTFGPYTVAGLAVYDNDIVIDGGELGLRVRTGEDEFYTSRGITFRDNTYLLDSPDAQAFYWNDTALSADAWQRQGPDAGSTFVPAEEGEVNLPPDAQPFTPSAYGPTTT
jgi:hypothetical protein